MKIKIIFIVFLLVSFAIRFSEAAEYAVALVATPVLNTLDFKAVFGGSDGRTLKVDRCGQTRELEFVALPGSVFTILKKYSIGTTEIYQVETEEYKASSKVLLYVDSRFVRRESAPPDQRKRFLPSQKNIVKALQAAVGAGYVWGGNVLGGVPQLATWYYQSVLPAPSSRQLTLTGLDCSGLLYYATDGVTPRNTSQLVEFGQSVSIENKKSAEIAAMLQPLDLIVWDGHVVIVLDNHSAIESRLECGKNGNGGVTVTELHQRLATVMRTRRPANSWQKIKSKRDAFVVRRWYGL